LTQATWALIELQIKAGKLKEAARAADAITHDLSRVIVLVALARAQHKAKDRQAAAKYLRDARKIVGDIEENVPAFGGEGCESRSSQGWLFQERSGRGFRAKIHSSMGLPAIKCSWTKRGIRSGVMPWYQVPSG
jgi:hypothetical protein